MFSKEIDFQATDIEFSNDQNLTIANNATAIIKDDGIIIKGKKIKYFKDKSLLIINNGKISSIAKNFEINSDIIEYKIDESSLNFENNIVINDGTLKRVIKNGKCISDLESLKKVISSNKDKMNVKEKKIRVSKIIFLKNKLIKYLSKVFTIILPWKLKSYK